jgi:hypothetical protein
LESLLRLSFLEWSWDLQKRKSRVSGLEIFFLQSLLASWLLCISNSKISERGLRPKVKLDRLSIEPSSVYTRSETTVVAAGNGHEAVVIMLLEKGAQKSLAFEGFCEALAR